MIFMVCLPSASGRGVGQQRELARVLHRDRDVTLVLDAVAGDPTRADLAAVGDELAEQRGVLVVDAGRLLLAELANLLLGLANHCLGHCGAPFLEARPHEWVVPEWLRVNGMGVDQNGGSSEPAPGAPHGSPAGADWPPPPPPCGAGVAHGSLPPDCWGRDWPPPWPPWPPPE